MNKTWKVFGHKGLLNSICMIMLRKWTLLILFQAPILLLSQELPSSVLSESDMLFLKE